MTDDAANTANEPDPAVARLAEEIRRLRKDADLSHAQLAGQIGHTRQYVSLAERPRKGLPSTDLVRALDCALQADGALITLREKAAASRQARRRSHTGAVVAGVSVPVSGPMPGAPRIDLPDRSPHGDEVIVAASGGRFFAGSTIEARTYPATDDGRVLAAVPPGFAEHRFLRRPHRGLVIGTTDDANGVRLFGLDIRQARRRLAGAVNDSRLLISRAYVLDDLTLGVLWAVSNLDEALLDDDAMLAACGQHVSVYERMLRSAAGREMAADLAPVSRMWLGSQFCARHILRHADTLTETPLFWTCEQRGEEASTWLLFSHKYEYLRHCVERFAITETPVTRAFCVPPSTVADSSPAERILLLLAVALMESFGIRVEVCDEPEYTALQGFALDQRRRAIVANWVGTDGIWQVDVTDTRPILREFADATGYAHAHSIITAPTPAGRLHALARYLDLDWAWLVRRCAELGEYGCAGFAEPRSRLLSLAGVDQACRFLGQAARPAQ